MGKVDIAATILEFGLKGISAKSLGEKTALDTKELERHLKVLESKGLAAIAEDKIVTTKRGIQFLDLYSSMHSKYLSVPA
jgi:predicted transcriptional regulator